MRVASAEPSLRPQAQLTPAHLPGVVGVAKLQNAPQPPCTHEVPWGQGLGLARRGTHHLCESTCTHEVPWVLCDSMRDALIRFHGALCQ